MAARAVRPPMNARQTFQVWMWEGASVPTWRALSDRLDFVVTPVVDHAADDVSSKHRSLPFTFLTDQFKHKVMKTVLIATLGKHRVYDRPVARGTGEHRCQHVRRKPRCKSNVPAKLGLFCCHLSFSFHCGPQVARSHPASRCRGGLMNSRAQMDDGGCRSCTYTMLLRPLSRLKR